MASRQETKNNPHVQALLRVAKPGDMIEFTRFAYSHWAIYIGDGFVIHRWGPDDGDGKSVEFWQIVMNFFGANHKIASIVKSRVAEVVTSDGEVKVNNYKDKKWKALPAQVIVERARNQLGKEGYSLVNKNCEHFATDCRYGQEHSRQVENAFQVALGGAAVLVAAVGIYVYAKSSQKEENNNKKMKVRS